MVTTHETHEDAWAWPCPYCGTSNAIESPVCAGCHAQLRDPDEDDLFTTVATENAHVVDPDAPRVREMLWSTEVPPEEVVAEAVAEPPMEPADPMGPPAGMASSRVGPFSQSSTAPSEASQQSVFDAGEADRGADTPRGGAGESTGNGPFGPDRSSFGPAGAGTPPQRGAQPFGPRSFDARTGAPAGERPHQWSQEQWSPEQQRAQDHQWSQEQWSPEQQRAQDQQWSHDQQHSQGRWQDSQTSRVTPDENGLSIAIEALDPAERERCAVPIGVCGALLGEQEVVLGVLAGYLMGHSSILMVTNTRILVGNSRRWKPLLDQFLPAAELMVHLRHDRDVASLTIVSGDRLTTVDGITDVTGAVELAERMRKMGSRGA